VAFLPEPAALPPLRPLLPDPAHLLATRVRPAERPERPERPER